MRVGEQFGEQESLRVWRAEVPRIEQGASCKRARELESLESGSAKERARSKLQESKRRIVRKK